MILRLATAPTVEPVTLTEAKEHLRLEHDLDDTFVTTLIEVARSYIEKLTWRALLSQTWELYLGSFPGFDYIELPKGTLLSVTSVKYIDPDGVLQTLSTDVYELDQKSPNGRVILKHDESWPSIRERWNSVQVIYVAGYGTTAATVPAPLRHATLLLISQMYEHRTPEITGTMISKLGFSFEALCAPYRLRRFSP